MYYLIFQTSRICVRKLSPHFRIKEGTDQALRYLAIPHKFVKGQLQKIDKLDRQIREVAFTVEKEKKIDILISPTDFLFVTGQSFANNKLI